MNTLPRPNLLGLSLKTIVVHTITYFFMGVLAFTLLNYTQSYSSGALACFMRPTSDPLVKAGVLFQPIRGLIFALAFYPLRELLFGRRSGWLVMWWTLVALGILSTFAPAPASIEGMIYTTLGTPNITSYVEIVPQAFLLSAILFYWVNHPEKKWLNWVLGALFVIVMLLPVLGLLAQAAHP
ncbi:MAG TPA: hypothetical protein VLZ89_10515 [Anaerolineales bacterium]|nr:hypothetical protein [Anaerolineales bacterium]